MKHLLFETDWLASRPVFYHEKTGKASQNINEVIDYDNLEFDPEGFNNYLDFGYSVFEQTPIKDVKFLRHSARLWEDDNGRLVVEYLADPTEKWLGFRLSESDVIDLIRDKVRRWEHSCSGEIIIPTSGGYDTRLLNLMIEDKTRIRSFTYGISRDQSRSFEVVYAQRLAEILGTRWEQIPLGDFHLYFDEWDRLYGVSTHAHGMYHIEFYRKIISKVNGGNPLLTGIIGDAWAGSVNISNIDALEDVNKLGYTHGLRANPGMSRLMKEFPRKEAYFYQHREALSDPRRRVIEAMRFKIILLSYLVAIPEYFGFKPWSPFLDIEVAMAMLNLPQERRRNRVWQQEYFQRQGVDFENSELVVDRENVLDLEALRRRPVRPLNVDLLGELIEPTYVKWINQVTSRFATSIFNKLLALPKVGGAMRRLRIHGISADEALNAYKAYVVLRPIENLLRKREGMV